MAEVSLNTPKSSARYSVTRTALKLEEEEECVQVKKNLEIRVVTLLNVIYEIQEVFS